MVKGLSLHLYLHLSDFHQGIGHGVWMVSASKVVGLTTTQLPSHWIVVGGRFDNCGGNHKIGFDDQEPKPSCDQNKVCHP